MSAVPVEKRLTGTREGALPVDLGVSSSTNGAIERQCLTRYFSVVRLSKSNPGGLANSTAGSRLLP